MNRIDKFHFAGHPPNPSRTSFEHHLNGISVELVASSLSTPSLSFILEVAPRLPFANALAPSYNYTIRTLNYTSTLLYTFFVQRLQISQKQKKSKKKEANAFFSFYFSFFSKNQEKIFLIPENEEQR